MAKSLDQERRLFHAKDAWDTELAEWNRLFGLYFEMEHQLRRQQERVHKAYGAYRKLQERIG